MSGTKAGGLKCAAKNKLIHGDDFYKRIGAKGGKVKNPNKGFGSSHERAVAAGRKGRTQSDLMYREAIMNLEHRICHQIGEIKLV